MSGLKGMSAAWALSVEAEIWGRSDGWLRSYGHFSQENWVISREGYSVSLAYRSRTWTHGVRVEESIEGERESVLSVQSELETWLQAERSYTGFS